MIAADRAVQRPADARLLVIDAAGTLMHAMRVRWIDFLRRGDIVVANDAATLPASLAGIHARSGRPVELRLAAWRGDPASDLSSHGPRFDAGACGTTLVRRNVSVFVLTERVRSPDGHMWPRSQPVRS